MQEGHSRVRQRPHHLGWRRDAALRLALADRLAGAIRDPRDPARVT